MNVGKTLFAQVMEFVPWKTFTRIIERHKGDAGVRTLGCADLFRVMAFAQLTWRESLRDIEACLAANQAKLFHMGLKAAPARSTLALPPLPGLNSQPKFCLSQPMKPWPRFFSSGVSCSVCGSPLRTGRNWNLTPIHSSNSQLKVLVRQAG